MQEFLTTQTKLLKASHKKVLCGMRFFCDTKDNQTTSTYTGIRIIV